MILDATQTDEATVEATLVGPADSPYEGGRFGVRLEFDPAYPFTPPKAFFRTKVFHVNIESAEPHSVCVDILKSEWSPALTVCTVLLSIHQLLAKPNLQDPLVTDIADMMLSSMSDFEATARLWTARYAK